MVSRGCTFALLVFLACTLQVSTAVSAAFLKVDDSTDPHHDGIVTHPQKHGDEEKPHHEAAAEHVDEHVQEHVEHGAEPQHSGVNGPCPGNQTANSVAVCLMAGVILMPLLVYMTMTKAASGQVSDLTFRMIDMSTSIFLAVLWFSATDDILESESFHTMFPHSEEVFAISQVLILYAVTMLIAYQFRENKYYLLTFSACAAHYIAFAAIKATGESQHIASKMVGEDQSHYASFGFCFLVFGVFALISFLCFFTWRRHIKNEELHLAIEELELDIVGLVLSFAIMQALRHALTGHYPSNAHLFLQQALASVSDGTGGCEDNSHHGHHTSEQRAFMLAFSVALTLLACLSLRYLEEVKQRSHYWMHKAVHVVQVVLIMCVAWGYLLWGEWQFYETYFHGDKMFGKIVFAVIATAVTLIIIISLAFATSESRVSNAKGYADLCVLAVSLTTAWSWEHCFHTAIDVLAEQYQVGYGGLVPKIVIAFVVPLVILPGYVIFLKPIVVEVDERMHAEDKESLNAHLSEVLAATATTEAEAPEQNAATA